MGAQAEIIVLEGLDATGKTAVSAALAELTGGVDVTAQLAEAVRKNRSVINRAKSIEARYHYWLSVNHLAGELAAEIVASGQTAVIDSYFFRTIATHRVLGMKIDPDFIMATAVRPDRAVLLTVAEGIRRTRLADRADSHGVPMWHALLARQAQKVLSVYKEFELAEIDTSGTPQDAAARIVHSRESQSFRFGGRPAAPTYTRVASADRR